ncbi:MAG TPA: hypothetical protein VGC27_07245 [Rhizomicrobium sp.]
MEPAHSSGLPPELESLLALWLSKCAEGGIPRADDLKAHELFHIYHHHLLGAAIPKDEGIVWWQMWEEGLATYVSKRLTPACRLRQFVACVPAVVLNEPPCPRAAAARRVLYGLPHGR